jgi:ankyrin repeat protein
MKRISWVVAVLFAVTLGGSELRLIDAVKAGKPDAVQALLRTPAGAGSVNIAEPDGTTALHWAAQNDELEIAKLLVSAGANVNAANRYGLTPLSIAADNADGALVKLLLEAGADAKGTIRQGETVLMSAAIDSGVSP